MSSAAVNGLAGAGGGIIAQIITYPLQTVPASPILFLPLSLYVNSSSNAANTILLLRPMLVPPGEHPAADGEVSEEAEGRERRQTPPPSSRCSR